jgi:hypothetical protein
VGGKEGEGAGEQVLTPRLCTEVGGLVHSPRFRVEAKKVTLFDAEISEEVRHPKTRTPQSLMKRTGGSTGSTMRTT